MKYLRFLPALILALCLVALEAQVRFMDLSHPDDRHEVASTADDEFTAPDSVGKPIEPPGNGETVPPAPLAIGSGRMADSDLFRPPQAARG